LVAVVEVPSFTDETQEVLWRAAEEALAFPDSNSAQSENIRIVDKACGDVHLVAIPLDSQLAPAADEAASEVAEPTTCLPSPCLSQRNQVSVAHQSALATVDGRTSVAACGPRVPLPHWQPVVTPQAVPRWSHRCLSPSSSTGHLIPTATQAVLHPTLQPQGRAQSPRTFAPVAAVVVAPQTAHVSSMRIAGGVVRSASSSRLASGRSMVVQPRPVVMTVSPPVSRMSSVTRIYSYVPVDGPRCISPPRARMTSAPSQPRAQSPQSSRTMPAAPPPAVAVAVLSRNSQDSPNVQLDCSSELVDAVSEPRAAAVERMVSRSSPPCDLPSSSELDAIFYRSSVGRGRV